MPKPYAYLGLAVWTVAVALVGIAPWLVGVYLGPAQFGGRGNPFAAIGAVIGALFFVPAALSPMCVMPACIGYVVGVQRADRGYPARVIPRESRASYARLCGGILCATVMETLLLGLWRRLAPIGDGLLVISLALVGVIIPLVLLVCSIVTGVRLARFGNATRHANAVCIHCGFAVIRDPDLGCPSCGGEVCQTIA